MPEAASSTSGLLFAVAVRWLANAQAGPTFAGVAIAIVAPAATRNAVARTLPIIVSSCAGCPKGAMATAIPTVAARWPGGDTA